MKRKGAIQNVYRLARANNFYDGMITCSTMGGYETVDSLKARLEGMYKSVKIGNVKGIAWFICRKGANI